MLHRFRQESRLARIVIVVFIATQVAIPAFLLSGPRPAHFGWQMYSGIRTLSEFTAIDTNGREEKLDPADYVGNLRLEMDLTGVLPAHICETQPDIAAVRTRDVISDEVVETPCGR